MQPTQEPRAGSAVEAADRALTAPGAPFELRPLQMGGGVVQTYAQAPETLASVFESGDAWGERTFIVHDGERLSFAQHQALARLLACGLIERYGVRKGDRIAIAMRNLPEWSIAFWAAAIAGAIVVPLNAWWTGHELGYALHNCGARVLIADEERHARLLPWLPELDLQPPIIVRASDPVACAITFDTFLSLSQSAPSRGRLPLPQLEPDDPATIFYTSGTTGRSKGALSSHRAVGAFLMNARLGRARATLRAGGTLNQVAERAPSPPSLLVPVPFFHIIGCFANLVAAMADGGKLVLMRRWHAGEALGLIEREGVSSFAGVPTVVMQAVSHAEESRRQFPSVQAVALSGAPAPPTLAPRISQVFPNAVVGNGYGLTESCGLVSSAWGEDYLLRPESVGFTMPTVDVRIVGPNGGSMRPGQVGEIWVRGASVMLGYWRNPQATAETITDGWLRTGDVGRLGRDGRLYIVDRYKDVIIRGGENIYSVEVENVLQAHPAVAEAAVLGRPHPELGEEVVAVVRLRDGATAGERELKAFAAERLANFKSPVRVDLRASPLPRNAAGKILKATLRAELDN